MSRGHGVWQRRIMEELYPTEIPPWADRPIWMDRSFGMSLSSLVRRHGSSRSDSVAARRATRRLAEDGQLRAHYGLFHSKVTRLYIGDMSWVPRVPSASPPGGYPDWITRKCDSCGARHSDLANDPLKCP